MADLPRYRPLGVSIGSMPSVNFVQTGKVVAQKYENIDRALGQISNYLYEQEVAKAKTAGARYGAEKAPTVEQLDKARQSGTGLREILPGDTDTVFGQAAQASAMAVIEAQMETSARNAITQLRLDAEKGGITADQYQVQLNGLIDGYSSSLAQLDPVAAVNFEASIAATANTNLLAYAKEAADKAEAQQKFAAQYDVEENLIPNIGLNYSNGITENGVTPDALIDKDREKVVVLAYATNNMALVEAYDKERVEARKSYFIEWASEAPRARYAEMRNGAISDPSALSAWNNMDDIERQQAMKAVMDAEKEQNALLDSRDRRNEKARKDKVDDFKREIRASIVSDFDKANELIAELDKIDPDEAQRFRNVIYTEGGVDDADVVLTLDRKSLNKSLTEGDIEEAIINRQINRATANRFYGELEAQRDETYNSAINLLSNFYQNPEKINYNKTAATLENLNALNKHKNKILVERQKDPSFDAFSYAESVINSEPTKEEKIKAKELENEILSKAGRLGLPSNITTMSGVQDFLNSISGDERFNENDITNIFLLIQDYNALKGAE